MTWFNDAYHWLSAIWIIWVTIALAAQRRVNHVITKDMGALLEHIKDIQEAARRMQITIKSHGDSLDQSYRAQVELSNSQTRITDLVVDELRRRS